MVELDISGACGALGRSAEITTLTPCLHGIYETRSFDYGTPACRLVA